MSNGAGPVRMLGRVTAGATHEMRNVLAIIKESAGLMEDVLAMAESRGEPPDHDKLRRAAARIGAQVGRGADLLAALNWLAHCPDEDRSSIDLAHAVEVTAALGARFVRQRGHRVVVVPDLERVSVTTSAVTLQQLLFALLDGISEPLPSGSELELAVRAQGGEAVVVLGCRSGGEPADPNLPGTAAWPEVEGLARELGARVEAPHGGVRLVFPTP